MKLYKSVIVWSQHRASKIDRGLEKAHLHTFMPSARKLPYLSDMTWSDRLASYVHKVQVWAGGLIVTFG